MDYEKIIGIVKERLWLVLGTSSEHPLDEKYVASACRDYSEALRALEQARLNHMKGEQ